MSSCLWIGASTALETGKERRLALPLCLLPDTDKNPEFLAGDADLGAQALLPSAPGDTSAFSGAEDAKLSFLLLWLGLENARLRSVRHQL